MLVIELSDPNLVSIPNFSSVSLQVADFSLFFGAKFCEVLFVNFVAMATDENVTNWFYLQKVSYRCIFKVGKFKLDTLSRFRMVEEKQEGDVFCPTPRWCELRKSLKSRLVNC